MKHKFNLKNIFLIFIIIQPFLDCYLLYSDEMLDFLGFSPTTIIRMLFIAIYCLIIFIKSNRGRKAISIYLFVLAIYMVIHHFVGISIDESLIYRTFTYSISEELFYFARMFIPVGVIYIIYNLDLTKEDIKTVIKYSAINLSVIMIVLNVTGLSLTSYDSHRIVGTIFDWASPNISNRDLASKGWFNSANQIGAVLIILTTMMEYYVLKEHKKFDMFVLVCLIISCMMVGTRTSSIIICYIIFIMFVSKLVFSATKKELKNKNLIYEILIIVFTFSIYGIAPVANCYGNNYTCLVRFDNGLDSSRIINFKKKLKYDGDTCNFIKKTPTHPQYYNKLYPCEENLEFWDNFAKEGTYKYANNRTMEVLIGKDVYKDIKSPMTMLFGMSRSRFLSAEFYIEKDVYVHYYTVGIFGIILLICIPYGIPCLYYLINVIKKRKLDYFKSNIIFIMACVFASAYLSGHVLDELIVTIYLAFITGLLLTSETDDGQLTTK